MPVARLDSGAFAGDAGREARISLGARLPAWINAAWMLKCKKEAAAFARAARAPERAQQEVLREIVRANRDSDFGRRHGFRGAEDARDFRRRVPVASHENLDDAIRRIARGERGVLTSEPVRLLEPTSGTSGPEKLIPFTDSLGRQFQRAIAAWIADLFSRRPAARAGRAYWSISPAFGPPRRSEGGIPIGFDDDTGYLGTLERLAMPRVLAAPSSLRFVRDLDAFKHCTLSMLLRARDLSLVSIWNPRFLSALLGPLADWIGPIIRDIRVGACSPPAPISGQAAAGLAPYLRRDPRRADELAEIFAGAGPLSEKLALAWPRLALISCWADAAAARQAEELRSLFPRAEIQPKGLLATEGVVTFPLVGRPGGALALRSHFYEFEPLEGGAPLLAHELEVGAFYRVIMTTGGGLYRYPLRDEVEVVGFESACPLLRFAGKADCVSDLAGEKLSEPQARAAIEGACAALGISPRFAAIVPAGDRAPGYILCLQDERLPEGSVGRLVFEVETRLSRNPHYRYALGLGQLAPLRGLTLDPDAEPGWAAVERRKIARGQKAGAIKASALERDPGLASEFEQSARRQAAKTDASRSARSPR